MMRDLAGNGGVCMINFFPAFISDDIALALASAPKRSMNETGAPDEPIDDASEWASYVEWFNTVAPRATLDQVVDHIVHAATIAGIDHVGIGSDFDGVPALPDGIENAALLPRLTDRLIDRGVAERDIEKILGGNFMRVFDAVEAGRIDSYKTFDVPSHTVS